jgi:GntR family histidine utilization transcriptional repressor
MNGVPAYQAIKDHILARIDSGEWGEGSLIPSENELARQFDVARMTVNRALRELTDAQVLTRTKGAGTYVAPPKYQSTLVEIRSIAEEIRARGHQHSAVVLTLESVAATATLAVEMQLLVGSPVFHSCLLHLENEQPVQYEERWVNPALAPDYLAQDFTLITPNEYLVRVAPLQRVEYRIEATLPGAAIGQDLAMARGEPALLLHRRTWSLGTIAAVANLWHPGNRYQFTGHF